MKYSRNHIAYENNEECVAYHAKTRQKQVIIDEMKRQGLRITNQRILVIDIILSNECSCCKEIFYQASRIDPTIGIATVYRMLKILEEIGVLDRKNLYRIVCDKPKVLLTGVELELSNQERIKLSSEEMKMALSHWMKTKGIMNQSEISNIYQYVNC